MALILQASWLLDGSGGAPLRRPVVTIDEGRIVRIEPEEAAGPLPADVIDCTGATILPGLIDAHVHYAMNGTLWPFDQMAKVSNDQLLDVALGNTREAIAAGITAARDCGERDNVGQRLRDEIASGRAPGPRILASGRPVTSVRGHCWYMNGEAATRSAMLDLVAEQIDAGIDFLKVMATGGGMTPGTDTRRPQFSPADLAAIVDRAHRSGLKVAAHVHGTAAIPDCVAAGIDTIEHCSFYPLTGPSELDEAALADLRRGRPYVVTTSISYGEAMMASRRQIVRAMYEAGVPIVMGTDAGAPRAKPSDLWREIVLATECGIPPLQAIRAATLLAAEALGIDKDTGSLTPGKRADLIVVAGDPLQDLSCLQQPLLVCQGGRFVAGAARERLAS